MFIQKVMPFNYFTTRGNQSVGNQRPWKLQRNGVSVKRNGFNIQPRH